MATVKPQLLCVDHYPRFQPEGSNATKQGYIANLLVLREVAAAANIPFWNFFNAM
jgi:hypothetical protein